MEWAIVAVFYLGIGNVTADVYIVDVRRRGEEPALFTVWGKFFLWPIAAIATIALLVGWTALRADRAKTK